MTSPISVLAAQTVPTTAANGAANSASSSSAATQPLLDPQSFLKLLVAQLQYQDPSSPVDTASFMNQTAQLSQVQTMSAMSESLTSLAKAQQIQAAADLVGKTVTYATSSGSQATGLVSGASVGSGTATLRIDGAAVPLTSVLEVTAPTA